MYDIHEKLFDLKICHFVPGFDVALGNKTWWFQSKISFHIQNSVITNIY